MAGKRKQTSSKTKAKKPKLSGDEYIAEFARKVETRQKNEPIKISRYYYNKAVEKIHNHGVKQKRKHPMIQRYGTGGVRTLNYCHSSAMKAMNRKLVQPVVYNPTWPLLVKMLRKALLAHNWSYCLRLFEAYLKYGALSGRHLLYLFRLTFLLLFNLKVSNERLSNFLTVTMSIRGPKNQSNFLWSLIELKKFSVEKLGKLKSTDVLNEEDDIPFDNSNFSDEDSVPLEDAM